MSHPANRLPPSITSVPILTFRDSSVDGMEPLQLGQGTGFMLRAESRLYLITNWHVVTGRDPSSGENTSGYSSLPQFLEMSVPLILGTEVYWERRRIELYDARTRRARWLVHPWAPPRADGATDVVALPIDEVTSVYAYELGESIDARELTPGMELSLVGYPFGVASGSAIWSRATVASEPRDGFKDNPVYLVDVRSRPGQSGSPLVARVPADDTVTNAWRLAGIYSGRVDSELDLGRVWWPVVISELLAHHQFDELRFE